MLLPRVKALQPGTFASIPERCAPLPGLSICPLHSPWRQLWFVDSIGSTQLEMARLANEGTDIAGIALWAGRQDAGRGRLDHRWHSATGGLYLTVALPAPAPLPPLPVALSGWLTLMAALACASTLTAHFGLAPAIKWPNDLFLSGRKLAGFLGERMQTGQGERLVIGMGLNWLNPIDPEALAGRFAATSLADHFPDLTLEDREAFIAGWLARLAALHAELAADPDPVSRRLAHDADLLLWRRDERVRFEMTERGPVEGCLLGLTQRAAARVRLDDESEIEVHCGHQAADSPHRG